MKIAKEVKVGIIAVIAIAFLIYGINYLKGLDLFKKGREFYTVYEDIGGLVPASPVYYNGMKVGQVTETRLIQDPRDKKMKGLVTFIVDNKVFVFPKDSYAKLISADLFGTKAIKIMLGSGEVMAVEGDTLASNQDESLQQKVDAAVAPLVERSKSLIGKLDTLINGVSDVLGENSEDLTQSIESFKLSLRNLKTFTDKVNVLMDSESGKISVIISKLESITSNISKNNASIEKSLKNVASITDSLAAADIAGTINHVKGTVENLNTMLAKVNSGEGTLGQLMTDDSLYNALVKTNEELNRLLENINEHPNRYLHFSVFGRKEKGIKLDAREEKKLKQILNQ